MFKKLIVLLVVASVPGFVFLTVRQVYKYNQVDHQVETLIRGQRELFEENKRMVANISILSSPERIDSIASDELDLSKIEPGTVRIEIEKKKESPGDRE